MKIRRLAVMALLAVSSCAAQGPQLASCAGPVWSANPALPTPTVWDDGSQTYFRFAGNMRIPSFFVVNPDGREAVADYTVDAQTHTVTVHQTALEFRLRDGDSVLCLVNHHYDPIGQRTTTGTTSPDVERVVKAAE